MKTTIGLKGLIGIVVGTALLAAAGAVALALPFSDTSGHPYEAQIEEITDAGCAAGFNDGTFRPADETRRGQFAYWLSNCGGRVWSTSAENTLTYGGTAEQVAQTRTLTTPGVTGSGQSVSLHLQGVVDIGTDQLSFNDFCVSVVSCTVTVSINDGGTVLASQAVQWNNGQGDVSPGRVSVPVQAVVDVPTGTAKTYSLRVVANGLEASAGKIFNRSLVVTMYPFEGNQGS